MTRNTMKSKLLSLLIIAGFSTGLFAQHSITNEKHQRVLSHVEANVFDVQFLNDEGEIVQEGQYWKDGDLYKPHGTWTLYSLIDGDVVTTSTFDKGERISVETVIDGKLVKADKEQLSAINKNRETKQLEASLTDSKEH